MARAIATGASGMANAFAVSGGGIISSLTSGASGPTANSATTAESWSAVAQSAPSLSSLNTVQAAAFDTGLPSEPDSRTALAIAPLVHQDFNVAGEGTGPISTVLGLAILGGGNNLDGTGHLWNASTTMDLSVTTLSPQDLMLGLLEPVSSGNGFDSLTFTATKNSSTILQSVTFTSLTDANAYFTDNAVDLGPITGVTSIQFQLSETTTAPGDSYDAPLIFGDATVDAGPVPTPEPAGMAVVGVVGAGWLGRRRRNGVAILS